MKQVKYASVCDYSTATWKETIYSSLSWLLLPYTIIWSKIIGKQINFGKTYREVEDEK